MFQITFALRFNRIRDATKNSGSLHIFRSQIYFLTCAIGFTFGLIAFSSSHNSSIRTVYLIKTDQNAE